MPDPTIIHSSGVDAESGDYGVALDLDELYDLIRAERGVADAEEQTLAAAAEGAAGKVLGPPSYIQPDILAQARWGIIWPPEPLTRDEREHRIALRDLMDQRRTDMNGKEPHEFHYQPGWSVRQFLWEEGRGVETGSMDPGTVPYYLLIVGSPERIPWEFQQHLDGEYAVGRLWFDDPADCEAYVGHLLSYEDRLNRPANGREILFVGTRHPNDGPTQSSAEHLVQPLQEWVATDAGPHFVPSLLLGAENGHGAYKRYVVQRLRGQSLDGGEQPPPAILFTAGHGVEYRRPMETQPTTQGALLFQDWPGPLTPPQPGHYLAGTDIAADTELAPAGMVAFCFACFSVGTPLKQDWVRPTLFRSPAQIASAPFVARLPQKLLAKGLLAFIGHVSRAWEYSFLGAERSGQQIATFRSTLYELLSGQSVGHATDYLNERWLKLNAQLDAQLGAGNVSKEDIAKTWLARNDCRGYAILGDPAARIRVDDLPVG